VTLTIHRGTHEIGGSCIEINTSTTRLFIDFGLPLTENTIDNRDLAKYSYTELISKGIAPSILYLLEKQDDKPTYLLLTHSHLDHYGLLPFFPSNVGVYSSKGTKIILEVSSLFRQTSFSPINVQVVEPWKPFILGDFTITPYLADHSAVDAFSYLIEANSKRLFLSGDLRAHGRKHILFENLVKNPPKNIDYLVLEGSTLGRNAIEYRTEEDVEKAITEEIRNDSLYIASFSTQNIDRFVSFFKACRKSNRIFVLDPYTAYVLDRLKELSPNIPQFNWDESFRIYFIKHPYTDILADDKTVYKYQKAKITIEEIKEKSSHIVIKDNTRLHFKLEKEGLLKNAKVIYSMWEGYLKKDDFYITRNIPLVKIHCSGHAYPEDLVRFSNAVKPKYIIPNHTFNPDKYKDLFGENVIELQDGQVFNC